MFFGEYSDDKFIQAIVLVFVVNIIVSWMLVTRLPLKRQCIKYLTLINLPLLLISGAYIGTFYSHGVDIPWPAHGFAACFPSYLLVLVIIWLVPKKWMKN